MPEKKNEQKVAYQEIALDTYLSTLLNEIPSDDTLEQSEDLTTTVVKEEPAIPEVQLKGKITLENKSDNFVDHQVKTKEISTKAAHPLSVMPEWAQHEFQALFFKVDKLILAVPLTELLRTIKIEKILTKIPGQPSWFMGLLDEHDQKIGVLDTGQLVLGKMRGQQRDMERQPFKSILITHDGLWGLACDEIISIGKLEPEKVRWRTLRKKRPWLIGTVIEELTAIIDVNQLVPHRKS